ncbi:MAG: hypothetical protein ACFB20_02055 [Opitutales bacterium]
MFRGLTLPVTVVLLASTVAALAGPGNRQVSTLRGSSTASSVTLPTTLSPGAGSVNRAAVLANPTTGSAPQSSLQFAPLSNQINHRFGQQTLERNGFLSDRRFATSLWGGSEMARQDGQRASINTQDLIEQEVLERKTFPGGSRRWGSADRNRAIEDARAYVSNWDHLRETVLVRKYADANVERFGNLDRDLLTRDVDALSLRDLNRFQFSSNRPDGAIPVQSTARPASRGLPPPSPIFDPDPFHSRTQMRSRDTLAPTPRPKPSQSAEAPPIRVRGEAPPPVQRGEWTIEARVKD